MPVQAKAQPAPIPVVVVPQQQVHPVYSTVGVPVNAVQPAPQPDHSQIRKYQLNVKFWSKFCLCMGYLWAIGGAIQIFGNVLFVMFMDAFPMSFDFAGQMIKLNHGYLFLLAVFKIVVAGFGLVQGKTTIKLFQSILMEYGRAERGETNGIRMERKSNQMKAHKLQIKKIIIATLGLGVFAIIITNALACDVANQMIEAKYQNTEIVMSSQEKKEALPEPVIAPEEPIAEIIPADHPFNKPPKGADSDFDLDKMLKETQKEIEGEIEALEDEDEDILDDGDFHWNQMSQLWGKYGKNKHSKSHKSKAMKKVAKYHMDRSMQNMTQSEAKRAAQQVVGGVLFAAGFFSAIFYLCFQSVYICFIRLCQCPQEKLEKHFMGPETSDIPNSQAAIRTIDVHHN